MIEIGRPRTVVVRTRVKATHGGKIVYKMTPKLGADSQPETRIVADEVWRVTREVLGGNFGKDRNRKLVVGFVAKDMIALRPLGTSREKLLVSLLDVYRFALHCEADRRRQAKMRETKSQKAAKRLAARLRAKRRAFSTA